MKSIHSSEVELDKKSPVSFNNNLSKGTTPFKPSLETAVSELERLRTPKTPNYVQNSVPNHFKDKRFTTITNFSTLKLEQSEPAFRKTKAKIKRNSMLPPMEKIE